MGAQNSTMRYSISHRKTPDSEQLETFKTIPECLEYFSNIIPEKEAMIFQSTDGKREVITFREVYTRALNAAFGLIRLGVKRNELVAINLRTCPEWLDIAFGAMMIGARPFGLSFTYTDGCDLIQMMKKVETCSIIVLDPGVDGGNWNILSKFLDSYSNDGTVRSKTIPSLRYMLCYRWHNADVNIRRIEDFLKENHRPVALPEIDPSDVAILFQTSGSTGVSKLVAHGYNSILITRYWRRDDVYTENDILFNDRPFNWVGGFPFSLLFGQTRVTVSGFPSPSKDNLGFLIDTITKEKCTVVVALPTLILYLLKIKDKRKDWTVRTIVTGGQPITKSLAACVGHLCKYLVVVYGSTETVVSHRILVDNPNQYAQYSCGTPFPGNETKIVDEDGEVVPVNTSGELLIKKREMFKRYYNDEEKTKSVMTNDGWYRTDDICQMTEEGVLIFQGRKSNIILCGGMNVAPEIIETVIKQCPGVDSAFVVPVDDEILFQVLCAYIVTSNGSDVTEEQIRQFCENIHNDKPKLFTVLPKYYVFLEKLPETFTGKTSRLDLKEMANRMFNSQ